MSAARVPLGGFEPLAVGYFWLGAEKRYAEGDLPEAVATYRLVTELSPHVGPAWALPAHLLVWTDSGSGDAEAEWRWVREGLALLDRGLELSPNDPELRRTEGQTCLFRLTATEELHAVATRELGELPEARAVRAFRALERVQPDAQATRLLTAALAELGDRHWDRGEPDLARMAYEEVLPRLEATAAASEWSRGKAAEVRSRLSK